MPFPPQNPMYAMPGYANQPLPRNWNPAPPPPSPRQMPALAAMATGVPPTAPRPTIRLQAPDPVKVAPALVLPSPETLGVGVPLPTAAAPQQLDWNAAHARLQRLGAVGFHLDHVEQGAVRVTFLLPAGAQRAHQIEVLADNETTAVHAALENAESWAAAH